MSNVLLVDGPAGDPAADQLGRPSDGEALDAYSSVITAVARDLAPSVANLRVYRRVRGGRRVAGGGSAFVLAPDGYLVTSAHVVEDATSHPPRSATPLRCASASSWSRSATRTASPDR